jgi:hypothetical protein
MALIECPECKKEVSDKAVMCPVCGHPIAEIQANKVKIAKSKKLAPANGQYSLGSASWCPCWCYSGNEMRSKARRLLRPARRIGTNARTILI